LRKIGNTLARAEGVGEAYSSCKREDDLLAHATEAIDIHILFWSAASQAVLTQQARPSIKLVSLQIHLTSSWLQEPKDVTQLPAQAGRPGMLAQLAAVARAAMRAKVEVRMVDL
jgi:hypothetical protein